MAGCFSDYGRNGSDYGRNYSVCIDFYLLLNYLRFACPLIPLRFACPLIHFVIHFVESIDTETRTNYEVDYLDETTGVNVSPIFIATG